jgi:dihydropteroate synthase
MHNRPAPDYGSFWDDLLLDLQIGVAIARQAGIADHQLWLDPGFGFAKTVGQNLEVIRELHRVVALGFPVVVGTSRKSTLGRVLATPVDDRLEGTAATVALAIHQGCRMIRVHDVREMARVARMVDAVHAGLSFAS